MRGDEDHEACRRRFCDTSRRTQCHHNRGETENRHVAKRDDQQRLDRADQDMPDELDDA
jgi:hypothetical protein